MKVKKRRVKKKVIYIFIAFIILLIGLTSIVKYVKYINSNPYKLGKLGYNDDQIEVILKLDDKQIEDILSRDYDKNIVAFMKQKYFMYKNLDRYLAYYKENKNDKLSHVVSIVNVNADYDWYDEEVVKDTNLDDGILMLVNKYNHLNSDYSPEVIDVPSTYAYAENKTTKEVLDAFKKMWAAAKSEGLSLIITSSYRTYQTQESLWNRYALAHDEQWADDYAARAGYSEHQTGLALDIVTYNSTMDNFEESEECKWLEANAYKYGFILRYPKGQEDLTGYAYEGWHYRYVGVDTAKKVHKEGITYDEYYAYYIEK